MFVFKRSTSILVKSNGISFNRSIVSATQPTLGSVYDSLRRKRDRKGLVSVEMEEESDVAYFPNEHQGLNYALNWTLNRYSITPGHQAYRNANIKTLFQHAQGKKESNGALSVQSGADNKPINYYLDGSMAALNNNAPVINVAQYKQLLKIVKDHISEHRNIFVNDAAIGSSRSAEVLVRTVTGDGASALFLSHLLPSTPAGEVADFKHPITLYLAPTLVVENPEQYGLTSSSFNIIDIKRGIAVIAGSQSTENVRKTLAAISQPAHLLTHQSVSLGADIFQTKDNKNVLVFNGDGYLLNKKFESGSVVSQGSLWNKDGLYRVFDAISYPLESAAKKPFDLIEKLGKKVVSTTPLDSTTNAYAAPASIIFMIKDPKGVIPAFSSLTAEQAEKYFAAGFNGDSFQPFAASEPITVSPKSKAELFKNLIQQNNTSVYIINPLSFQKDADVDKLISVISSGKVNKSSTDDSYTTLSPIKLAEAKTGGVDKKKINDFETSLEATIAKLLA